MVAKIIIKLKVIRNLFHGSTMTDDLPCNLLNRIKTKLN